MFVKELAGGKTYPINALLKQHLPAAATAAVITLAASTKGTRWVVHSILASYSAAPTGGRLTISGLVGTLTLDLDLIQVGPTLIQGPFVGIAETAVVITLASGAGAVVGKLNAIITEEFE